MPTTNHRLNITGNCFLMGLQNKPNENKKKKLFTLFINVLNVVGWILDWIICFLQVLLESIFNKCIKSFKFVNKTNLKSCLNKFHLIILYISCINWFRSLKWHFFNRATPVFVYLSWLFVFIVIYFSFFFSFFYFNANANVECYFLVAS